MAWAVTSSRRDPGNDALSGGEVRDALDGGDGVDVLDGGDGTDTLAAVPGGDQLTGGADGDILDGGDGDDALLGGDGSDAVDGGGGADALDGEGGDDIVHGGEGDDSLTGDLGRDGLDGGAGSDSASYAARQEPLTITLGSGADDGASGEADNVASIETVVGGSGDDSIAVDPAWSGVAFGGPGNDRLSGSPVDRLYGGAGDDVLDGRAGPDVLDGEDGLDTVTYVSRTAPLIVALDGVAGDGERGENDLALVERVVGGQGADQLTGGVGAANRLDGGPGDDLLNVRGGDPEVVDEVFCGAGTDIALIDSGDVAAEDCEDARTVAIERDRVDAAARALKSPSLGLLTFRPVVRRGVLKLRVRCYTVTTQRCRVHLGAAVSVGKRMLAAGSSRFTLLPGRDRTVRLRVTRRLQALIRSAGRRGARLRVTLTGSDGVGHVNRRVKRLRLTAAR